MLQILKETTVWASPVANHTYLLDNDKLVAYAKFGGDEVIVSKTQIKIDKRYRTFERDTHPGLTKLLPKLKTKSEFPTFKVESGSKDYYVTEYGNKYSCTCPGYTFRGKCKHSAAVAEMRSTKK